MICKPIELLSKQTKFIEVIENDLQVLNEFQTKVTKNEIIVNKVTKSKGTRNQLHTY